MAVFLLRPAPVPASPLTWDALLQPLGVGQPVALGHVLGPPRRGEEHDIVFTARAPGGGAPIEIHVLDRGRWPGIRETPSFGVAYETPRSAARTEDCEAVTEAMATAIRANDPGQLGPVDKIPLRAGADSPAISRTLDRVSGARGVALGICLSGFTWILATAPGGPWAVSIWLFLVGLLLRAPALGVPFLHDQDVQRLFTGHLPVGEVLLGQGLTDRHPPLYFLVLHGAQRFGQSEAIVRAPAVFFGALVGPAVVWGAKTFGRRIEGAALAGLVAAVSVELIARSREVSSIPLFALFGIVMSVSIVRHAEKPSRRWAAIVATSHALALWTYYLAPFVIAGNVVVLLLLGRLRRPTARALGAGLLAGTPALVLGVATLMRDRGARAAASAHPMLAWGERGPGETARLLLIVLVSAFGIAMLLVLVSAVAHALPKRDAAVLAPIGSLVLTFVGIAAMAPVARVQPYYLVAVLPLLPLAVGLAAGSLPKAHAWAAPSFLALIATFAAVPQLSAARGLYESQDDAFMPGFAEIALALPERRVVPVAHYDGTLIAYYLARQAGLVVDWGTLVPEQGEEAQALKGTQKIIQPLARSHAPTRDPDEAALEALERLLQREAVLVIERDGFRLSRLSERLRHCTLLSEAGTGRLYRCSRGR